jgi:hypothetical protein
MDRKKWIVSTVLAVLGIVVPVAIYLSSLPDKALTYQVISETALIGSLDSLEDIEIKISGEIVTNAAIHLLKIRNSGSEPIKPADFEKPIFIKYAEETKILRTKIKNKTPENISVIKEIEENLVLLQPFLMNPDDEFIVEVLSTSQDLPILDIRIAGIKSVDQIFLEKTSFVKTVINLVVMFLLLIFYAKSFRHVFSKEIAITPRIINIFLSLTCAFSSAQIAIDYENLIDGNLVKFGVIGVAVTIGVVLAPIDISSQKKVYVTNTKPISSIET